MRWYTGLKSSRESLRATERKAEMTACSTAAVWASSWPWPSLAR